MATDHIIVLSVPGLRPRDVTKQHTPTLYSWANSGTLAELTPSFPCVTSPVQATMFTGTPPCVHGVIGNGFYDRDAREVAFWVAHNDVVAGEQIWDIIRKRRPGMVSAVWHAQNIKSAGADYIVTPSPIHTDDGSMKPWCYSKPDPLYQELVDAMGHFPLQHYWGPLAGVQSTEWILKAAWWLIERHAPNYHWVYIPHLDYASQKFGPNSEEAAGALAQLDSLLGEFARGVAGLDSCRDVVYLVVGEYAMTDVSSVVHPNRRLREAGLVKVAIRDGAEFVDMVNSSAFAVVDHQFAHVYVSNPTPQSVAKVADVFRDVAGIVGVHAGADRAAVGMGHSRAGDIVLIAEDTCWFTYYWWSDDEAAPPFARTVDIHQKPGYDPVELFFDPATKGIPLDASLVKGSHGVPATAARHEAALICSDAGWPVSDSGTYRDTDIRRITLDLIGL